MLISDMKAAVDEAKHTIDRADTLSLEMARLISGRLHKIGNGYFQRQVLVNLKRELKNFDARTRTWSYK